MKTERANRDAPEVSHLVGEGGVSASREVQVVTLFAGRPFEACRLLDSEVPAAWIARANGLEAQGRGI
jgi:hypothetical protein